MIYYKFCGTMMVINTKIDDENIGVGTSFVILSCMVFEISSKMHFSVMEALYYVIWRLRPRTETGSNKFF